MKKKSLVLRSTPVEKPQSRASEVAEAKQAWPPGPWHDEPDRVEFRHAGLPCLLLRNRFGAWCGYAAVPPGHSAHGQKYDDVEVEAHGGLTYSGECRGSICHVPEPGEPDNVWWLGFDCAHYQDLAPGMLAFDGDDDGEYRDVSYARAETERLAEQLAAV